MTELTIDQALQKGIEAHKCGQVQEANRIYTAILQAQPKHPHANHNMGILAVGVGKVQQALSFFKTALEANPTIGHFWISYIDTLIKLERSADAKAVLDQARGKGAKGNGFDKLEHRLKEVAEDAIVGSKALVDLPIDKVSEVQDPPHDQLQSLINLYSSGQHQQALDQGLALLTTFPRSGRLYNIFGALYKALGQLDNSIKAYKEALRIDPSYADIYNNMGVALQAQGKLDDAIEVYSKALAIKPKYAEAANNIGGALKEQGKLQEAIEAYAKAIAIKPDYSEAYYNMSVTFFAQGKLDKAFSSCSKALSIKPDYAICNYNLGIILTAQGLLEEAIAAYIKALALKPNYVEVYNNIGNILQELDKPEEALESYNMALSIKPEYAEALNNIGIIARIQGKLEEAIDAFRQALALKPDYAEAYSNMGNALLERGKVEEAVLVHRKAIEAKPDYVSGWNNLAISLQIIKMKVSSTKELLSYYPLDIGSHYFKSAKSILNYRVNRGDVGIENCLVEALDVLGKADSLVIKNPENSKTKPSPQTQLTDKVVALVHFGRSGTGLLHSLIDGHPEVSTLPSIYLSEYFDYFKWQMIVSDGWDNIVDRFMATYAVLFDAASAVPVETKGKKLIYNIGIKEGLTNVGEERNEVLSIDRILFRKELQRLVSCYDQLDAFVFFQLVHKAYDKVLNDTHDKSLIFYHIHNPDTNARLNFVRFSSNANWVMMVREPVQSCESWLRKSYQDNKYNTVAHKIIGMLFEINDIVYHRQNSIGVRLEDLKERPRKTIPALCNWLGISGNESLYQMTSQGKRWWGDPVSPDFARDGMNPFGKTSIKRKVGSIFTEKDQFVLQTLFYPFSVRFGYVDENVNQFKINLQTIRPMLDDMFDFEREIIKKTNADPEVFMKSGSYLYLRSGLIQRWNTLNKFGTYPNMIKPLRIN